MPLWEGVAAKARGDGVRFGLALQPGEASGHRLADPALHRERAQPVWGDGRFSQRGQPLRLPGQGGAQGRGPGQVPEDEQIVDDELHVNEPPQTVSWAVSARDAAAISWRAR